MVFSRKIVSAWGCHIAEFLTAFEDSVLYDALISGDITELTCWLDRLILQIETRQINHIIVDAFQGYSVTHDLANLLARLAVMRVEEEGGRKIKLQEFAPVPESHWPRSGSSDPCSIRELSWEEIGRKISLANQCEDLMQEINWLRSLNDPDFFLSEKLYELAKVPSIPVRKTPYYEKVGRQRVQEGVYHSVLCHAHFETCSNGLVDHAGKDKSRIIITQSE